MIIGKGNYTGTKQATFRITATTKSLSSATVSYISGQTYTGSAITPKPTVKVGSTTLRENTDYTLSYRNNVNAGTATVTITGRGGYTGSTSRTFTINPRSLSYATISYIGSIAYTGKAICPRPLVRDGSKLLVLSSHYTLSYRNNVKIGTATVTITGKGNYTGSVKRTFKIVKGANPLLVQGSTKMVSFSKVKKKKQVISGPYVSRAQGKVSYSKVGGSKALTVNKKTGKITVKKGTKKGTYSIRIKVSAAGSANSYAGSKTATVRVIVR